MEKLMIFGFLLDIILMIIDLNFMPLIYFPLG